MKIKCNKTNHKKTRKQKNIIYREITKKNLYKIIYCARLRDYIENQGFKEQKSNKWNRFRTCIFKKYKGN